MGTKEVPELRTRRTRTYVAKDGTETTRFYVGSVNYRDLSGDWQQINNRLVPTFTAGYAYRNQGNRYLAEFPQDLSNPVRFKLGDDAVTMKLEGAQGIGSAADNEVQFTNALPGVSVRYQTGNDVLKETLLLSGPGVQSSFRFKLRPSAGVSVEKDGSGGLDFVKDGDVAFSLAAPVMQDSSHLPSGLSSAVDTKLEKLTDGYLVTITPDQSWLGSAARVWPVALDPTIYMKSGNECRIVSNSSSQVCGSPTDPFLAAGSQNGYWGPKWRSLLRFDVDAEVPRDATVTNATLSLYNSSPPAVPSSYDVCGVTQEWNSSVNWSTTNGSTFWTQAGGTFDSSSCASTSIGQFGYYNWASPPLTQLVQNWVNGASANRGVLLKGPEPTSGSPTTNYWAQFISSAYLFPTYRPQLQVVWKPTARYTSTPTKAWVADGGTSEVPRINAMKRVGDTLYVGGDFDFFGKRTGAFASISTTAGSSYGQIDQNVGEVAGNAPGNVLSSPPVPVRAIADDGSGGWFVGGDLKYAGGHPHAYLAHIRADGSADPTWDPQFDGTVYALARSGNDLYVGGSFTTANGYPHKRLALVDASTGKVASWNQGYEVDGSVRSLLVTDSRLYAGGDFTQFGSNNPRKGIVAIDRMSGSPITWYPGDVAGGSVNAFALDAASSPQTLYVGGSFSSIGGASRSRIAAIDVPSGTVVSSWNPGASGGSVDALAFGNSRVFAGGSFTSIGSQPRNGIAQLFPREISEFATTWNASTITGTRVRSLVASGSDLYVGGYFRTIGGQNRRHVAALSTTTAAANEWNPAMGNEVYAVAISSDGSGKVGVGGRFVTANGVARKNLAALNAATGEPTSWNPSPCCVAVNAIEEAEGKLFVGGGFSKIAGLPAGTSPANLASFITETGKLTSWRPVVSQVKALRAALGKLYVGASTIANQQGDPDTAVRSNAASFSTTTGKLTAFEPKPNGAVTDFEVDPTQDPVTVYMAGQFTHINDDGAGTYTPVSYLAAVLAVSGIWRVVSTGAVWDAHPNGPVNDLALVKDKLYVGGGFSQIGQNPQPRQNLAALDPLTGAATNWNPAPNGPVTALAADAKEVYVGGRFTSFTMGGQARSGLAAISTASDSVLPPFDPGLVINTSPTAASGTPRVLDLADERVYLGGDYYAAGWAGGGALTTFANYGRMTEPKEETRTGKRLTLEAVTETNSFTNVRFEYCQPEPCDTAAAVWSPVPAGDVKDEQGNPIGSWPANLPGGRSPKLVWDVTQTILFPKRTFWVHAIFSSSNGENYLTDPVRVHLDRVTGGPADATVPIGPGTLDLATGNLAITRDDVSIDAFNSDLTFSRTYNSLAQSGDATGPLGPGWTATVPVDAASSDYTSLTIDQQQDDQGAVSDVVTIKTSDGSELAFVGSDGQYEPEPGLEDLSLARRYDPSDAKGADSFQLRDLDGNVTVFHRHGSSYTPDQIFQAGNQTDENQTTLQWDNVAGSWRVTGVYAPGASAASCASSSSQRCRYLEFDYASTTTATGYDEDPTKWGSYAGQLDAIAFHAYDPCDPQDAVCDPNVRPVTRTMLMQYRFDVLGRLRSATDDRPSPALTETYSYDSYGMTKLTPPGQEAFNFSYDSPPLPDYGKLVEVTRFDPNKSQDARTTVNYGVPLSGSSAPIPMAPSNIAAWGQTQVPTDAVAVVPPDATSRTSYDQATLYYLDRYGRETNVATPSGKPQAPWDITTTEYDSHQNVTRELTASNRARILTGGSADSLYTTRQFSADGLELQHEWGPVHQVQRPNGDLISAREHTAYAYDENLPADSLNATPPHLPTTVTVSAAPTSGGDDVDGRTTKYSYVDEGLMLRKPTSVTQVNVDGQGQDLTTVTRYNGSGQVIKSTTPAGDPNGTDAHTTRTYYYLADSSDPSTPSECQNKPYWTGLPCLTTPASQPGATQNVPDLLETRYKYNRLFQVNWERDTDPKSGTDRTTVSHFDDAGRSTSEDVTSTEGTSIPQQRATYDPATGLPYQTETTENQTTRRLTREYDTWGRIRRYTDADGNVSTTSYDIDGRVDTTTDGMSKATYHYDPSSGLLTQLDNDRIGVSGSTISFGATYDEDGSLKAETYPNGLTATTTYDEVGSPTHLTYTKVSGACGSNCTWLDFAQKESIHGQVMSDTTLAGPLSSKQYSYDGVGRLTQVDDTAPGGTCTRRAYEYNKDTDRTSLTTGPCGASGTPKSYSYDAGDRLTENGIKYDAFGRITLLPATYAGGGDLTSAYYVNDLVQSQTQDGVTNAYQLDPARRQRLRTQTGSQTGSELYHYADDSDSPSWIATSPNSSPPDGSTWSRNISGIDGALAAIQQSGAPIKLQLSNLHGDIVATVDQGSTSLVGFEADEFGVPKQENSPKYSWLGAKQRRTELASGVVQMGVRSYVPALGRFLQPDPVAGGSANDYDYVNQDPVNQQDLGGTICFKPKCLINGAKKATKNASTAVKRRIRSAARSMATIARAVYRGSVHQARAIVRAAQAGGSRAASAAQRVVKRVGAKVLASRALTGLLKVAFASDFTVSGCVSFFAIGAATSGSVKARAERALVGCGIGALYGSAGGLPPAGPPIPALDPSEPAY